MLPIFKNTFETDVSVAKKRQISTDFKRQSQSHPHVPEFGPCACKKAVLCLASLSCLTLCNPMNLTRLAPLSMGASLVAWLVRKLVKGKMCLQRSSVGLPVVRGWLRSPA